MIQKHTAWPLITELITFLPRDSKASLYLPYKRSCFHSWNTLVPFRKPVTLAVSSTPSLHTTALLRGTGSINNHVFAQEHKGSDSTRLRIYFQIKLNDT